MNVDPEIPATRGFTRHPLRSNTLALGPPPPRDWAIDHWLGMAHVTLLAGKGGIGKTLIAQQIGSALALGRPFVDEIARPRKVLMWAAEDDHDEIWRRQVNIAAHFNVGLDRFAPNLIIESFADRDCTLMDCDMGGRLAKTAMLEELQQQIADYVAEVVILDNAARTFGGKENDRHHVTRFMAALNEAARVACVPGESPAAIMLLAHPGRAIGAEYSGSSAWENSARSRMFLIDRPPDAASGDDDDAEPNGEMRYVAHWIQVSRQVLDDVAMLQNYIETRLRYGLMLKEEDQLLRRSGVGNNIEGMWTAGTAYSAPSGISVTAEQRIDRLRIAIAQLAASDYIATGILLNPIDWANIELAKAATTNEYLWTRPGVATAPVLWGVPVIATNAINQDTFMVGDFQSAAVLLDRESARIDIATQDQDDFVRNMVKIRCEERIGLAVRLPQALIKGADLSP